MLARRRKDADEEVYELCSIPTGQAAKARASAINVRRRANGMLGSGHHGTTSTFQPRLPIHFDGRRPFHPLGGGSPDKESRGNDCGQSSCRTDLLQIWLSTSDTN